MKVIGFTENYNTCDCCGRTNLKGTYCVDDLHGNFIHFGSTCVKKKSWYDPTKGIQSQIDENRKELEKKLIAIYNSRGGEEIENKIREIQRSDIDFNSDEMKLIWSLQDQAKEIKKQILAETNLTHMFKYGF